MGERQRWWDDKVDRTWRQRLLGMLPVLVTGPLVISQLTWGDPGTVETILLLIAAALMVAGVALEGRLSWRKWQRERESPGPPTI